MDSLITIALDDLTCDPSEPQKFRQFAQNRALVEDGDDFHATLHQIRQHDQRRVYESWRLRKWSQLEDHLQPQTTAASRIVFQLIKIHSTNSSQLLKLLEFSGIEKVALLALKSGPFHFQCFNDLSSDGDASSTGLTFGLAYDVGSLLWHYDPEHQVRAIAIGKPSSPFTSPEFDLFKDDLNHPLALPLLAIQAHIDRSYFDTRDHLMRDLDFLEKKNQLIDPVGSSMSLLDDLELFQHLDLDQMSRIISRVNQQSYSLERLLLAPKTIITEVQTFLGNKKLAEMRQASALPWPDAVKFKLSAGWCLKWIDSLHEQTQLFMSRVQVLNAVIFQLTNQRDAKTNIQIAESSKAVAEAAKRDSSSMQTIAVVTMALLPATFFAALFAMPLFKWDETPVIQSQFPIYLAFTLPSTLLIFIIWIASTKMWLVRRLFTEKYSKDVLARLSLRR